MLTRWIGLDGSWRETDALWREMERLFGANLDPHRGMDGRHGLAWASRSAPRVSVCDEGEQYVLSAEIPGLSAEEIEITVTADHVTVAGEHASVPPEGYRAHRIERRPWKFSQSYALPGNVDADQASAVVRDGLLTVTLPKVPELQPRRIAVKAD